MRLTGTWLLLTLLAVAAQAQLRLLPVESPPVVFGGAPSSISVTFSNSSPQEFNSEIRTRLSQASAFTVAVLAENDWEKLEVLSGQTVLESARLDFPAVKAETKFLVEWLVETNRVIGTTTVWVYPTNLLAELKPLLNDQALGVLDPNNTLKPLLKQNGVEFADLGESALEDFHGRLAILGPFRSQAQLPDEGLKRGKNLMTNGTSVLWLQPPAGFRDKLQPSYFSVISGTNAMVIAQASLVENLADNPQSQVRLLELCRQVLQPAPPSLPDPNHQP